MSSTFDENLLEKHDLVRFRDKLKLTMGETIWNYIQIYNNSYKNKSSTNYDIYIRVSLKALLDNYNNITTIYKKDENKGWAIVNVLIDELYFKCEKTKEYLRQKGFDV